MANDLICPNVIHQLALKRDFEKLHKYSIEKDVVFCTKNGQCLVYF